MKYEWISYVDQLNIDSLWFEFWMENQELSVTHLDVVKQRMVYIYTKNYIK